MIKRTALSEDLGGFLVLTCWLTTFHNSSSGEYDTIFCSLKGLHNIGALTHMKARRGKCHSECGWYIHEVTPELNRKKKVN